MSMQKRELLKSDTFCIMAQDCFDNKSFGLANGFPQIMRLIMKTTETLANSLESDQARNFDKVLKCLNFSCNT